MMKIYIISGNVSKMDSDEMIEFIVDSGLQDWNGVLDFSEAKGIATASDEWVLTELPLDYFPEWMADPSYSSVDLPPIVLDLGDGDYEVLDGKHRIGAANAREEESIKVYLGKI